MDWDPNNDKYTLIVKNAGLDDMGIYTIRARNDRGETSVNAKVRIGEWPIESYEDPYVKLNIIDVTTSESGSDTDDDIVETTKKKLAQLIEEDPDLSIIEEERSEHSEQVEDSLSEDSSEDTYAPRIEIVPEPVCVNEGETIRLATKVTGQKVNSILPQFLQLRKVMVICKSSSRTGTIDTMRIHSVQCYALFVFRYIVYCYIFILSSCSL